MRDPGPAAEDVQYWGKRDINSALPTYPPLGARASRWLSSQDQTNPAFLGQEAGWGTPALPAREGTWWERRLLGSFGDKALNFRTGPVLVKIVMPAIGKTHETLGLVGEHE
jgi:hypothetical protein